MGWKREPPVRVGKRALARAWGRDSARLAAPDQGLDPAGERDRGFRQVSALDPSAASVSVGHSLPAEDDANVEAAASHRFILLSVTDHTISFR
jgi:hypothetical protein